MAARSAGIVVEVHATARAHVNPLENYFRYGPISLPEWECQSGVSLLEKPALRRAFIRAALGDGLLRKAAGEQISMPSSSAAPVGNELLYIDAS